MKQKIWILIGLLTTAALLVAACGPDASVSQDEASTAEVAKNADGYADISVHQLAGMLENKDVTLVNVHIPYEGEIPQTDLFIPFDEVPSHLNELPDRDAAIVIYCRSGGMSTSAAQELASLGYTSIMEVDGGFNAWKAAGYELLQNR
jgi:rhodanese-related sulfurtransferase